MNLMAWMFGTLFMWFVYSGLTIYGALRYPYYSMAEKFKASMAVLALPFIGAYLVNHDMGYRLSNESKQDLAYDLPWWASFGVHSSASHIDDD